MTYTVVVQLNGALADAVAVEWTDRDVPGDAQEGTQGGASGPAADWQPCIRLGDGVWRFASREGVEPRPHLRAPGPFGNIAIRYRLTPAGPWSAASADRKEITIRAEGDDGGIPAPLPPLMIAAPGLLGTGKIGSPVTAEPGTWTGAEAFVFQWCRDGADIPGAAEAAYTPEAADDLTALTCRVLATGPGGQAEAVTAALAVTHVAPTALTEDVLDEIHDAGTGMQSVETAGYFTGEALVFAVSGAGATIDPATGVVGIPTETPVAGETVVVTARNSGGSALLRLLVTVEAAPVEEPPAERTALADDEWEIVGFWEDPLYPGRAAPVIEVTREGITPTMLIWENADPPRTPNWLIFWNRGPNWTVPAYPGQAAIPPSGRPRFVMRSSRDDRDWHTGEPGWTSPLLAIKWTDATLPAPNAGNTNDETNPQVAWIRDEQNQTNAFSPYSTARKRFTVPADLFQSAPSPSQPATTTLQSSISLRGTTWTLSKAMPVGYYWNGDPFVVNAPGSGGFSITSISPTSANRTSGSKSGTRRHGAMRNPSHHANQGFDQALEAMPGNAQPDWSPNLNVDPGYTGQPIGFSAGQQGSVVKSVGLNQQPNDDVLRSILGEMVVLTVVREVPAADAFRPSPHGQVTSKASPFRLADMDMSVFPQVPITGFASSGEFSLNGLKQRFKGPWPSWCVGSNTNTAYGAAGVTFEKQDTFYGPHVARSLGEAYARLCARSTGESDRLEIAAQITQIGIDYGLPLLQGLSAPSSFWGRSWCMYIAFAGVTLRHKGLKELATQGHDHPSNDIWDRYFMGSSNLYPPGPGPAPGRSVRATSQAEVSHIPPAGHHTIRYHSGNRDHWPRLTPIPPEDIGKPVSAGGRSGLTGQFFYQYGPPLDLARYAQYMITAFKGGEDLIADDIYIQLFDRRMRGLVGDAYGTWRTTARGPDGDNASWFSISPQMAQLYEQARAFIPRPVYRSNPDQLNPPLLTKPANGQIRVQLTPYVNDGGRPITQRQVRWRSIANAGAAFQNLSSGWSTPANIGASTTVHTITGLSSGLYQVQVRQQNELGWSGWSTNAAWRSDEGNPNIPGIPAGPRAVIAI